MCQLCKHYGKQRITNQKTLRLALEEAQAFYKSDDDEMLAHIDALTNCWFFGKEPKREAEIEEDWERSHR